MLLGFGLDEVALFFIAVVIFLAVVEACFRLGLRHRDDSDADIKNHISSLQAALLGLLALLLGFTFAMAVTRFETRKSLVLEESNAIGKAYWRSQIVTPSQRAGLARQLRDYVKARVDFHLAAGNDARLQVANAESARIEQAIWTSAGTVQQQDPSTATLLFIQSVNDMFEVNEKRRVALENRVPEPVLHLLFIVSVGALGFIAYGSGLTGRRRFVSTAIFATLIAVVLTFIRDIDEPTTGLIRVGQESMLRLQTTLEQTPP